MAERRTEFELRIIPADEGAEIRTRLVRSLTTIGADQAANVQLPGVPGRWAVVQSQAQGAQVRLLGSGESHELKEDQELELDGVKLSLRRLDRAPDGLPVQPLVDQLSDVESPKEALELMLAGVIEATQADSGAIILREEDDYTVAVARQSSGGSLDNAAELLSDNIVREVLNGGAKVWISDADRQERYANIPSIISLKLRSVLCVPMQLHDHVLGAIFLGKHELRRPFNQRQVQDLSLLASMCVPLLIQLRRILPGTGPAEEIILGESEMIRAVRRLVERVAPSDLSVLVQGATGTGKELVARAVHAASPRSDHPMVVINCAAVPEGLLEAELFGCKRGAFTGAVADRPGRIEQAHQSTLFLDEVGDMPLAMQAALLRVLEDKVVTRLGENQTRAVDFRLITATHKDLEDEVAQGNFRQDLLYRLKEFTIELPLLSSRGPDILLLAQLFLRQSEQQLGLSARRIGRPAADQILNYSWPGNVRQLRAAMRRAAILCDEREITPEHLSLDGIEQVKRPSVGRDSDSSLGDLTRPLAQAKQDFTARYVAAVLTHYAGDREKASAALGISIRSLYRYLS
jgi:DNA-binding NtrC family response regulator